jgi:hypothetical protein
MISLQKEQGVGLEEVETIVEVVDVSGRCSPGLANL